MIVLHDAHKNTTKYFLVIANYAMFWLFACFQIEKNMLGNVSAKGLMMATTFFHHWCPHTHTHMAHRHTPAPLIYRQPFITWSMTYAAQLLHYSAARLYTDVYMLQLICIIR